jgi:ATP-dependent DNA helicase RecQ
LSRRRVAWQERSERPGWRIAYTPAGGVLASSESDGPLARAAGAGSSQSSEMARRIGDLASQAMFALPSSTSTTVDPDADYLSAVVLKFLQRGTNPIVRGRVAAALHARDTGPDTVVHSGRDLLRAAIGPVGGPGGLDSSVTLDPTYEQPFWEKVRAEIPALSRFLVPQPDFESLVGSPDGSSRRWGDFLLATPFWDPILIELDGAQHGSARAVDASRDRAARSAGLSVHRCDGRDALDDTSTLWAGMRSRAQPHRGSIQPELSAFVHGPAIVTRLGMALALLLRNGFLAASDVWDLDLAEPFGLAEPALLDVLDLFAAVEDVWGLDVLPEFVRWNGGTLRRTEGRFVRSNTDATTDDTVLRARVLLESMVPAHAALPDLNSVPTVVVRGTYLPVSLDWLATSAPSRRDVGPSERRDRGLSTLVRAVFGHPGFRRGQVEAIGRVLAGEDACVLLPTGAGKSLIYQLAGLLRPGLTIVVDPIVSLIDDQERRLLADGIDRVAALHTGKVSTREKTDQVYETIAGGGPLFAFLTPERLQTSVFRDALGKVASRLMVNLAVIDEAHCVSEWGHDFRTAYLRVGRNVRLLCRGDDDVPPPLLALTGTASPAVLADVRRELADQDRPFHVDRAEDFDRANLAFEVVTTNESGMRAALGRAVTTTLPSRLGLSLDDLVRPAGRGTPSGLIFVPHVNGAFGIQAIRDHVRKVAEKAGADPRSSVGVYAGTAPRDWHGGPAGWNVAKTAAAAKFLADETSVLVSTKAFGMGVDKPNIRWTMHVGFPSSIESFAQEAGRAGRDGAYSHCLLVSSLPDDDVATHTVLDPSLDRGARSAAARQLDRNDLSRQLYFLGNSFKGEQSEFDTAVSVLRQLWPAGTTGRIEIPRPDERDAPGPGDIDKALFRLSMIGVVDDYTVDYGAKKYTVDLGELCVAGLDEALSTLFLRVDPGRASHLMGNALRDAPVDPAERAEAYLREAIGLIYGVVEPSRVHAMREMYRLVKAASDPSVGDPMQEVRRRIRNYLSDGPAAGVLARLAATTSVDVPAALQELDETSVSSPEELAGAAARQLEAYPDHPILRLARAVGEMSSTVADVETVFTNLSAVFSRLGEYGIDEVGAVLIFDWVLARADNFGGRGKHLSVQAWLAWERAGLPSALLIDAENRALDAGATGSGEPEVLRLVLHRRVERLALHSTPELDTLLRQMQPVASPSPRSEEHSTHV